MVLGWASDSGGALAATPCVASLSGGRSSFGVSVSENQKPKVPKVKRKEKKEKRARSAPRSGAQRCRRRLSRGASLSAIFGSVVLHLTSKSPLELADSEVLVAAVEAGRPQGRGTSAAPELTTLPHHILTLTTLCA